MRVQLVGFAMHGIDIAVLATDQLLSPTREILPTDRHYYLSQDAFFLGFPYGMMTGFEPCNNGYPIPFVKKATISNFGDSENGTRIIYFDGHNNPGFSGGPVFYNSLEDHSFRIAGVVFGFRFSREPIYIGDAKARMHYQYNTGITLAYGIEHALEVIHANPIGFGYR